MTNHFSESYKGNLVQSGKDQIKIETVRIEKLNDVLIKASFDSDFGPVVFRAAISKQKEGILLFIQNRVTRDYILNGQSGFIHKKGNVHGGLLRDLDSFYFHVRLEFFNGSTREYYFLGKNEAIKELTHKKSFLLTA